MEPKKIAAGIIFIDTNSGDLLLGRRSYQSPNPNTYSPFGGKFEPQDGNPQKTAEREFQEETGIDSEFQISKHPFYVQDDAKKTFYNYLGLSNGKPSVKIDKEHITYGWYPLDNLPSNLHPGFADMLSHKKAELEDIIQTIKTNRENES